MPLIKLSSITNLHDARFGAGMGSVLDMMIGFSLNPNSQNYVSEQDFVQISGWITGCKIAAELESNTISEEAHKILSNKEYKIDFIQVYDLSNLVTLKTSYPQIPIIFSYQFNDMKELENVKGIEGTFKKLNEKIEIDYFLLELKESNSINLSPSLTQSLQKIANQFSIILGFGVTSENVIELLSQTEIKGIAFKGQTEKAVGMGGYTDFDEISAILEKIEEL